jgi:hypothetical protein
MVLTVSYSLSIESIKANTVVTNVEWDFITAGSWDALNFSGELPSLVFPSARVTDKILTTNASGRIQIIDYRGVTSGYSVLAEASDLVEGQGDTLPIKSFRLSVVDSSGIPGVTDSIVKGLQDVEIYKQAGKVIYGQGNTNGFSISGEISAVIELEANQQPKVNAQYHGTITWTLQDVM